MENAVLVGLFMLLGLGVANLRWRTWKARRAVTEIRPIALDSLVACEMEYFPSVPQGYAGYTDYTAMNVELNDGLAGRSADEQFTLIGFGQGFTDAMLMRLAEEGLSDRCTFRIEAASYEEMQCLGWLSLMQNKGTDNAAPSTGNLQRVISKVSTDLAAEGPITMKFWHKFHSGEVETLEGSGTMPEDLNSLLQRLEYSKLRGEELALEAVLYF